MFHDIGIRGITLPSHTWRGKKKYDPLYFYKEHIATITQYKELPTLQAFHISVCLMTTSLLLYYVPWIEWFLVLSILVCHITSMFWKRKKITKTIIHTGSRFSRSIDPFVWTVNIPAKLTSLEKWVHSNALYKLPVIYSDTPKQ